MGGKYYAVRVGRRTGIYNDWGDVKPEVEGYPGAQHKSFKSRADAEAYISSGPSAAAGGKRSRDDYSNGLHGYDDGNLYDSRERGPPSPPRGNPYAINGPGPSYMRAPEPLAEHQNYPRVTSGVLMMKDPPVPAAGSYGGAGYNQPQCNSRGGGSSGRPHYGAVIEGPLEPIRRGLLYDMEFDGAARGNPGTAGCGALLRRHDTGQVVCRLRKYMGPRSTNNEAEYTALLEGLKMARSMGVTHVLAKGDSKLVVQQVGGAWRINKEHLQALCDQVRAEVAHFDDFNIRHIPREWNHDADKLSNDAIDLRHSN